MTPPSGAREPTEHELAVVHAVAGGDCDAETLDRTRILVAETDEEMFDATGYCGAPPVRGQCSIDSERVQYGYGRCPYGCAVGAFRHYREGVWPFVLASPWWPLLVLWGPSYRDAGDQLLAHEAAHLAEECRGEPHDRHTGAGQ